MKTKVIRAVSYKLRLAEEQKTQINNFMNEFGEGVKLAYKFLEDFTRRYELLDEKKEGECSRCKEEKKLSYLNKDWKTYICSNCFYYQISDMWLTTKASGFPEFLKSKYQNLSVYQGYYAGIQKFGAQSYKSYYKKKLERQKEIRQLKISIESETDMLNQSKLKKRLEYKLVGLKELNFRKNLIYFGSQNMIELKKENNKYYFGLKSWKEQKQLIWVEVELGDRDTYKTQHNKYNFIEELLKTQGYKKDMPKLRRVKEGLYELMLPKKDLSDSLTDREELFEMLNKNPNIPIVNLTFGVKKPLVVGVVVNNKIKEIRNFGNGELFHKIDMQKKQRAKINRKFAGRYKSKWKRNKAKKRYNKKRNMSESNFIKYQTHKLTTEFVKYLKSNYGECVIVMQDTKGIKRINYPPVYRKVLDRWNIEFQKQLLDYKYLLKNIHIYQIPYSKANNMKCSKCMNEIKKINEEGKEEVVKNLTVKLIHAMNKKSLYRNNLKNLKEKLNKLEKYPKTEKTQRWIKLATREITLQEKAYDKATNEKPFKSVECSKCNYKNDFYINDCLTLYSLFKKDSEVESSHAEESTALL